MIEQYERATVKHWNDEKAYGFLRRASGGQDVFFHVSAVRANRVAKGDVVEAVVEDDPRRPGCLRASSVRIVEPADLDADDGEYWVHRGRPD
jgi:cold shock CspA family protein